MARELNVEQRAESAIRDLQGLSTTRLRKRRDEFDTEVKSLRKQFEAAEVATRK